MCLFRLPLVVNALSHRLHAKLLFVNMLPFLFIEPSIITVWTYLERKIHQNTVIILLVRKINNILVTKCRKKRGKNLFKRISRTCNNKVKILQYHVQSMFLKFMAISCFSASCYVNISDSFRQSLPSNI